MCYEYHVSLDVSLRILPRCKKQRTAENILHPGILSYHIPWIRWPVPTTRGNLSMFSSRALGGELKQRRSFEDFLRVLAFLIQCFYVHAFHFISFHDFYCRATPGLLICLHSLTV